MILPIFWSADPKKNGTHHRPWRNPKVKGCGRPLQLCCGKHRTSWWFGRWVGTDWRNMNCSLDMTTSITMNIIVNHWSFIVGWIWEWVTLIIGWTYYYLNPLHPLTLGELYNIIYILLYIYMSLERWLVSRGQHGQTFQVSKFIIVQPRSARVIIIVMFGWIWEQTTFLLGWVMCRNFSPNSWAWSYPDVEIALLL